VDVAACRVRRPGHDAHHAGYNASNAITILGISLFAALSGAEINTLAQSFGASAIKKVFETMPLPAGGKMDWILAHLMLAEFAEALPVVILGAVATAVGGLAHESTARTASARDDGKSRLRHAYSLGAVGVNVVLLFMLVVVTVQASRALRRERLWEIHTLEVKNSIRSTALAFMDCESNQRSYLLTGNEAFAKAYRVGRVDVLLMVDRLDTMTKDNPRQQARVSRIAKLMKMKLEYMDSFMQKRRTRGRRGTGWTCAAGTT
jgi:hypothetical protein